MPRPKYPSDHRRWFRVCEDILDDERLNALDLEDQALYFRLLATLNRQKSRDGRGSLDTFAACALARRERWAYALPAFYRLAAGGLVAVRYRDGGVDYLISKWPKHQGFTPAQLRRDSVRTPSPTPTTTPTPKKRERRAASAAPRRQVSEAPEDLSSEQKIALKSWCEDKHPELVGELRPLVDACLDWHRAKGNRHADWVAACRTWIRRDATSEEGKRRKAAHRAEAARHEARREEQRKREADQRERGEWVPLAPILSRLDSINRQ